MKRLSLFAALSAAFEIIFLDQYGVLHDGYRAYPGAVTALKTLRKRGTKVVIVSNSGRPGQMNALRMAKLGFSRDLYDHFLTSGDVAKMMLQAADPPIRLRAPMRCMTISSSDEHELADSVGLASTESGDEADLVVISGSQADRIGLEDYAARLAPAARRRVPCVCTNPDKRMLGLNGAVPGAGAIAELYERLGGTVIWIGKPFPAIYSAAASLVGSPDPGEILCVGDSVEHDIVGAHRFGAVAALVRTGIHAALSEAELVKEFARHGIAPDIILSRLEG
ncbi:MAG: TIGR01459 family HAD-type hydrolase [Methylocella sp.]